MQKKIIALAVAGLMSGAASAQSNVTLSGLFDAGLLNSKTQVATGSTNAGYNGASTSNLTIAATEDLGGGMRSGVVLETDIRGNNVGGNGVGGFQHYVWIGGNWGTLSLGQRTNLMTTTLTTVQPFGTAMGGGFAGASAAITSNRLRGGGADAYGAAPTQADVTGTRDVRPEGVADYRSPSMSGFTVGLQFRPRNSDATETTASYGYLNLGANYNNGPLNLTFADSSYTNAANVAGGSDKIDHTALGGNYAFGPATVYLGWTRSTATIAGVTTTDSRSWNIALRYAVSPSLSLMANVLRDDDKRAANVDRTLNAFGADYSLSKRTTAYARVTDGDADKSTGAAGKFTQWMAGLRHSF
jgi:predicted porin